MDIFDLQDQVKELEVENMKLYSEAKSIVGWPMCGKCPPTPDCFTDEEFEDDAKDIIEEWILFLKDINKRYRAIKVAVERRYKLYDGEEAVEKKDVVVGKSSLELLSGKRIVDLQ